jgi:hypothetical protein
MPDLAEDLLSELGLGETQSVPITKEPLYVRDLTAEDIASLSTRAAYGSQPGQSIIQKLRAPHHTLARLVAEGKKHPECAVITGYTVEYIVMLERDPAFQELVAYYKENVAAVYINVHERLAALGAMAMEIIQERMTDPEKVKTMTTGQLREIMNDALDRSVAPSKVNQGAFGGQGQAPDRSINIHFVSAPSLPAIEEDSRPQAGGAYPQGTLGGGAQRQPSLIDITPEKINNVG